MSRNHCQIKQTILNLHNYGLEISPTTSIIFAIRRQKLLGCLTKANARYAKIIMKLKTITKIEQVWRYFSTPTMDVKME